ncbi:MAG: hypothetical protein ACRCS3_10080 [Paracoccaceae bacterium]
MYGSAIDVAAEDRAEREAVGGGGGAKTGFRPYRVVDKRMMAPRRGWVKTII